MKKETLKVCMLGIIALTLVMGAMRTSDKPVYAAGYDCVLIYDKPGDIWINLYKEDVHGNKGQLIGQNMHFAKGLQFGIPLKI